MVATYSIYPFRLKKCLGVTEREWAYAYLNRVRKNTHAKQSVISKCPVGALKRTLYQHQCDTPSRLSTLTKVIHKTQTSNHRDWRCR